MSTADERLSVPRPRKSVPRQMTPAELDSLVRLADVLCGPSERAEPPSRQPEYAAWLDVALAARSDSFDVLMDLAARAPTIEESEKWLRQLDTEEPDLFQRLSAVLGGAYLMVPAVREAIGYPGQRRDPARIEDAVDQVTDGILDPVLERGYFFVPTPTGE